MSLDPEGREDAEEGASVVTAEPEERDTNLLGEVLSLPPRLASRTIAQIQASQRLLGLLGCGAAAADTDSEGDAPEVVRAPHESMPEPIDVLEVIADHGETDTPAATGPDGSVPESGRDAGSRPDRSDADASVDEAVPGADALAIPGYDSLAASQVVPRLTTLTDEELDAIGAYESAHRGRRTILNRVKQLRARGDGPT